MGFFKDIKKRIVEKKLEMDERREFMNRVDEETKPFRRSAYMKQMMKEAVNEGIAKAKVDAKARLPKEKKSDDELGIMKGLEDPYKFMNSNKKKENKK